MNIKDEIIRRLDASPNLTLQQTLVVVLDVHRSYEESRVRSLVAKAVHRRRKALKGTSQPQTVSAP